MRRLIDVPPVVPWPTESSPEPVIGWPGWLRWQEADGHHARRGRLEVSAEKFTELLGEIRKIEGGPRDGRQR